MGSQQCNSYHFMQLPPLDRLKLTLLCGWQFLEKAESALEAEALKSYPILASVIKEYEASGSDELTLWKGGIVTIDDQSDAEWWHGDLNGKKGIFPKAVKFKVLHEIGYIAKAKNMSCSIL
jgi:hypothetical protein